MKRSFNFIMGILLLLVFTLPLSAQSGVGKLSGKIIDAATGEALIGANIVILNTDLGAATNIDGEYFILNITPGTYDLRASYVGYAPKLIKDVRIVAGITYELNIDLSADFELEEIVVEGRKMFEEKSTNTTKVYDSEEIQKLPVKGVSNIASLNAGVVAGESGPGGEPTLNVRGGRGGEVLYIIDGVPQNDVYTGGNYAQVSNAAVEQISFQIGGYEAKYGQAQSGIINVTTKSGSPKYSLFADVLTSEFTDNYGYNLYTATLGGPWIPGQSQHTFFFSAERGYFQDGDPKAIGIEIPSADFYPDNIPENNDAVWRFSGRTMHSFGAFQFRLGANVNLRDMRGYVHSYAKSNLHHNPRYDRENISLSARLSHNISNNAFWNLNVGVKQYQQEFGDGVWFDQLEMYGDSAANAALGVTLPADGLRINFDQVGLFSEFGRVYNGYQKYKSQTLSTDFDVTMQLENHLLEAGGGFQYSILREYYIGPIGLAGDLMQPEKLLPALTKDEFAKYYGNMDYALLKDDAWVAQQLNDPAVKDFLNDVKYERMQPSVFGYDITGQEETSSGDILEPKTPLIAYAYIQDRYELSDMVLNVGVRFDYMDTQADILRDPALPFGFGNPNKFDDADYVKKDAEFYISPRIGLGFPVTSTTVFHAQYGKFIQQPSLDLVYTNQYNLNFLLTDSNSGGQLNTGHVDSEITTQYEVGFRQIIADKAALNITAFYKNTEGLINTVPQWFRQYEGGALYYQGVPSNTDFGTVKGLSISLDVNRVSYFSLAFDYTLSLAEGTGSSTSSANTAVFRNQDGEFPKVIAPLSFDQRHTGIVNVDFTVPKGELGLMEMFSANILFRFNSGQPYTPLEEENIAPGGSTNVGDVKGYINSAYGPGNWRVDLKVEKTFLIGDMAITPYLWVENVFDTENELGVYSSTGSAYTTGYLETATGKKLAKSNPNYASDYRALERNPYNFGIPRLIKLGLRVNFAQIEF